MGCIVNFVSVLACDGCACYEMRCDDPCGDASVRDLRANMVTTRRGNMPTVGDDAPGEGAFPEIMDVLPDLIEDEQTAADEAVASADSQMGAGPPGVPGSISTPEFATASSLCELKSMVMDLTKMITVRKGERACHHTGKGHTEAVCSVDAEVEAGGMSLPEADKEDEVKINPRM
eukprot:IDg23713t1